MTESVSNGQNHTQGIELHLNSRSFYCTMHNLIVYITLKVLFLKYFVESNRDDAYYINRWANPIFYAPLDKNSQYITNDLNEIKDTPNSSHHHSSNEIDINRQEDIDLMFKPYNTTNIKDSELFQVQDVIKSNSSSSLQKLQSVSQLNSEPSGVSLSLVSAPSTSSVVHIPNDPNGISVTNDYSPHIKTFPGSTIFSKVKQAVLPWFSFIKIVPSPCTTGTGDNGTCVTAVECRTLGGSGTGSCASGLGTCCVFQSTCGDTVTQNCTYFVNTNYPQAVTTSSSCRLTVSKLNSDICQLRLDFIEFILDGPETTDHVCITDSFKVLGSSTTPTICGINTGQHMYVTLGPGVTSPPVLMVMTTGTNRQRKWKIKITQIPCSSSFAAPSNCLQYYTGVQGTVSSYNYNSAAGLQLSNQDYSICIRNELNFCGIQYAACTDSTNTANSQSFTLTGSTTASAGARVGVANCPNDWIIIPCVSDNALTPTDNCQDRLCGDSFNIENGATSSVNLYSFVTPFTIFHHTNSLENGQTPTPEESNRGFCLNYSQQPCA